MLLTSSFCLPPLLTHKSFRFQVCFGRCIPKMLLCFAGTAAGRGRGGNPRGKQTETFHLADRRDRSFNLPREKLVAFFRFLFRSQTSGLGKIPALVFKFWGLPWLRALAWCISVWTPKALQEQLWNSRSWAQQAQQEQNALPQAAAFQQGEEMLISQITEVLSKCSCIRYHRIYSVLVLLFLLKLTRNPPTNDARVNKLNNLTVLITFSETGSFHNCSNLLFSYFLKHSAPIVMRDEWSLSGVSACHLFPSFTLLECHAVLLCRRSEDLCDFLSRRRREVLI